MAQTFEEMCAERDLLYAATRPRTLFLRAIVCDEDGVFFSDEGYPTIAKGQRLERDSWLLKLAIEALKRDRP